MVRLPTRYVSECFYFSTSTYVRLVLTVTQLSRAIDAAYCYLLQTIERVWQTDRATDGPLRTHIIRNIGRLMSPVVKDLSIILIRNPVNGVNAGPCFNYYPGDGQAPLAPADLHTKVVELITDAANITGIGAAVKTQLLTVATHVRDNVKPTL